VKYYQVTISVQYDGDLDDYPPIIDDVMQLVADRGYDAGLDGKGDVTVLRSNNGHPTLLLPM